MLPRPHSRPCHRVSQLSNSHNNSPCFTNLPSKKNSPTQQMDNLHMWPLVGPSTSPPSPPLSTWCPHHLATTMKIKIPLAPTSIPHARDVLSQGGDTLHVHVDTLPLFNNILPMRRTPYPLLSNFARLAETNPFLQQSERPTPLQRRNTMNMRFCAVTI